MYCKLTLFILMFVIQANRKSLISFYIKRSTLFWKIPLQFLVTDTWLVVCIYKSGTVQFINAIGLFIFNKNLLVISFFCDSFQASIRKSIFINFVSVAINCLLEAAGDKDEVVRETVSKSLRRLAKKYAVHVLQNAVVFRQKNPKVSN